VAWEMVGAIKLRPPYHYHFDRLCERPSWWEPAMPCPLLPASGQELTTKVQAPDRSV
jgi:hypothetical protein